MIRAGTGSLFFFVLRGMAKKMLMTHMIWHHERKGAVAIMVVGVANRRSLHLHERCFKIGVSENKPRSTLGLPLLALEKSAGVRRKDPW